jgi:hypothetical protein
VRLELIENQFRFPAFMIGRGQLSGRDVFRIGDIGDQRYDLLAVAAVRDLVIDDRTYVPGRSVIFARPRRSR